MKRRTKIIVAAAATTTVVAFGATAAYGSNGDSDTPITGPALEQASGAAIAYLDGGTVTETEVGDEESYYEVEVTLDDGTQVDVQLNEQFEVVGTEAEGAGETED